MLICAGSATVSDVVVNARFACRRSGEVCAIVGLKNVETGDTLVLSGDPTTMGVCLGGVAAPKPVLTVRLDPRR